MAEEAARDYQSSIEELTFNSKLHINVLTMIAGENHENGYAEDIVKVIANRIAKAPSNQKLPVLYLMDSIMKNLRESQYASLFSPNIVANFATVFEQVDEKKRQSMYKLRQTWNDLFPNFVLYAMDRKIHEIDPAWPITAQQEEAVIIPGEAIEDNVASFSDNSPQESPILSPSIHVNPKFLKKQEEELARKTEEDRLRAELLLKQKEDEGKKKKRDEEETKKKWEEEQERKMREEFMSKQQELMRLQQQKLELELEETRRNLKQKELELQRKDELERIKEQEREREHQRQIDEAKKLAKKQQEEERKEKERREKERRAQEKVEKERIEEERRERDRKVEESKRAVMRSRDPRKANEKLKANADPRLTPSPTKFEKPVRKTDSPVRKNSGSRVDDKRKAASRKATGRKITKSERHYRKNHRSSSSDSDEDEKPIEIQPQYKRSRSPERRKRKLSPSGTELIRHKKSASKFREQKSAEFSKTERSKPKSGECVEMAPETAVIAPQSLVKKSKTDNKKEATDLLELFGKEDIDYRKLPPIPKLQNISNQHSAKSPSVGWTKFKQARPETFAFRQPRRMSVDNEIKSPLSAIRGQLAQIDKEKSSKLATTEDILQYAELQRSHGILTEQQHDDLLKQLAELYRLKRKVNNRAQRESLDKKQMPLLPPPPKPPLLECPVVRKPLLPDPVLPGRDAMLSQNFHEELPRSPSRTEESSSAGFKKKPLLPPPVPPRTLLEAPRRPREPLLNAPHGEGPPRMLDDGRPPPLLSAPIAGPPRLPGEARPPPLLSAPMEGPIPPQLMMRPGFEPMFHDGARGSMRPRMPREHGRRPGHRFNGPEHRFGASRELLPRGPTPLMETDQPPDANVYIPEEDERWYRRVYFSRDKSFLTSKFEVVINRKPYDLSITRHGKPKKILFGRKPKPVRIDLSSFELFVGDMVCYRLHEHERTVTINGLQFSIYVRGPTEKMWIDGHQFEVRLDAPPESVLIANVPHDLIIDRQNRKVVVDGVAVCPWDTDGVHEVFLGPQKSHQHIFQFFPPSRRIIIDGEECTLDLSKTFPAVEIKRLWHGIRFDGQPRQVHINDHPYTVHVDSPRKIKINEKPLLLALGGPGHEVIIEDEWYEVKFNGPPVYAKVGSKTCKLQLKGAPSEVKILGVIPPNEAAHQPPHRRDYPADARCFNAQHPEVRPLFDQDRDYYSDGSPCRPGLPPREPDAMNATQVVPMPGVAKPDRSKERTNPLNVNDLFSKLLSTGIIKKVDGTDSPSVNSPASQPNRDSPVPLREEAVAHTGPKPIVIQPIPYQDGEAADQPMDLSDEQTSQVEKEAVSKRIDYYSNLPWLADFDLDMTELKEKYSNVIRCMYTGIQCTSCAARFHPEQTSEYKEHLDWHFRQNKRETQDSKVVRNRRWYYEITDWVQYEEIGDADEKVVSNYFENMIQTIQSAIGAQGAPAGGDQKGHESCPVASGNDEENMCDICRDPFEQFYDDDEEEWHLRDAVRVDGRTYHPVCYEDFKEQMDDTNGAEEGETEEDENAMDVGPSTTETSTSSEPINPNAEVKTVMKSEPVVKESPTAPAPILDMVSNPLAYLTALSQRAKQANTSLDEAAKLPTVPGAKNESTVEMKTEMIDTSRVQGETVQETTEPVKEAMDTGPDTEQPDVTGETINELESASQSETNTQVESSQASSEQNVNTEEHSKD